MLEEKINELRQRLNDIMGRDEDANRVLQISEELDLLILEYYKEIGVYKQ